MIKQINQQVELSQIRLETFFRNKVKDLSLEMSIKSNGIRTPLIVEEESKDRYVLVDGYRRFYALEFLEIKSVICIVEEQTSEEERIIKRLEVELHSQQRTAFQLERMIKHLLESKKFDVKKIARNCKVTEETIAKYVRGFDVPTEWIDDAEELNIGRHALTIIHKLDVSEGVKEYLFSLYKNKEITIRTLEIIKKAAKEKTFKEIPEENLIECINHIIEHQSRNFNAVREIIHEISLLDEYNESSHKVIYNLTLKLIGKLEKILSNSIFLRYLSTKQKSKLNKELSILFILLNPPEEIS
ncbi:ParB N-terminal domain-containing protein [Ureibacillus chungkukjangi]|uniref:ParB/RepB/Spo0J family partition protein n=1 Tax=Ureibacillus chungkukjangi TaxID=1202712 RepID=UPI00384AA0D6